MDKNKFARNLKITIDKEKVPLCQLGCNYALLNDNMIENQNSKYTNLEEVYNKVFDENIKNNTQDILSKLDNISYLFGGK